MDKISGMVFNIQGYSIHDGPGIRTTVFLSGCPLRCKWCQNPESFTQAPKLFFIRERCTGCGRCKKVCLQDAISITDGVAVTNRDKCTACGDCVKACLNDLREISGKRMTAEEVVARVSADKLFFNTSGGGVTLSGGEVLRQPSFAVEILRLCKAEGLHTAIETCGLAEWSVFEQVLKYCDLVLFDIKHMNPEKHREGTGQGNEIILENARRAASFGVDMAVRVPLIPGYNDSTENLIATARFAANELGENVNIHLLPYHRMGESKYERMETVAPVLDISPPDSGHMNRLREIVLTVTPNVIIGG